VVSTGGINFDFDVFQGAYTVGVQYPADISFNDRDAQTYYKRWWVQHEHLARQPQGNGLWLPELVPNGVPPSANNHTTNWNANVTGVNVSIATLASLQMTGQPLAGVAVDPRIYAEYPGGNPNVIILTPANSTTFAKAQLWANPLFTPLPNTPLALRFWATGSIAGNITWSVTGNSGTTLLSRSISTNSAAFTQFGFNGVCLSDTGCTTCDYFQIAGITNQTIYLIAPNLTALDFAPYSLGPLPAGVNYWGEATVANLPGATYLSLGTTAIALNGCNTGEAAGSGTGCPVFVKSVSGTPTWCAVWSGVAVTY
jgi:hypothetical protein